jgi:hypothetical protein
MKYLKSYKQPTDISALLGRHKKSWWDGRVCQVFRSHLGHDKRKVLTNEFKVKSTCHPNSASLNYLANGSKAARNVVMIIISTIKEKIPEKRKKKSRHTSAEPPSLHNKSLVCLLNNPHYAASCTFTWRGHGLVFSPFWPSSIKSKEKRKIPAAIYSLWSSSKLGAHH